MKKILKTVLDGLLLLLTGKGGDIAKQAVDDGICDFSRQGRGLLWQVMDLTFRLRKIPV